MTSFSSTSESEPRSGNVSSIVSSSPHPRLRRRAAGPPAGSEQDRPNVRLTLRLCRGSCAELAEAPPQIQSRRRQRQRQADVEHHFAGFAEPDEREEERA